MSKFNSRYSPKSTKPKTKFGVSCTLPGQACSVSEMIENFRAGIPVSSRQVVFGSDIDEGDEVFPKFTTDLTDIDFARERAKELREQAREEIKEKSTKRKEKQFEEPSASSEKETGAGA